MVKVNDEVRFVGGVDDLPEMIRAASELSKTISDKLPD